MSEKNSEGRDPKVVGTADNPVAGPEEVTKGQLIAEGTGSASELASGPHAHLDRVLVPQAPTEGPVVTVRKGMWGPGHGSGDTSGFSGMTRIIEMPGTATPPFGG